MKIFKKFTGISVNENILIFFTLLVFIFIINMPKMKLISSKIIFSESVCVGWGEN